MIRKNTELTMQEAIQQLLETYKLSDQFLVEQLKLNWEELVGKVIANRTEEIYVSQHKLYLRISSASLKQELIMMKTQLIKRVNDHAGKILIRDLQVL